MLISEAARNSSSVISISLRKTVAGIERDAAERGVADGARLLVDFLEHEVLVAGLFGLDGVPGDALDLALEGSPSKSVSVTPSRGEDGDVAIGEEVDVAGVVQDAGDVGGDEVFAFAQADDGGRPIARGDDLVGLVGGDDADGEGAGERATARRTASSSDSVLPDSAAERISCSIRWAMISVSVSVTNVWPSAVSSLLELQVVLDDAVVHDDDAAGAVAMRMRILFGGAAVRGPAGVADAVGAVDGCWRMTSSRLRSLPGARRSSRPFCPVPTAMPAES